MAADGPVTALSATGLARLVKLLRLLGSDFDGERAAAGLKIHQLVAAHQADWDTLLRPPPAPAVTAAAAPRTWAVTAENILGMHFNALRRDKEVEFVTGLLTRGYPPTERQAVWLADICDRCGVPLWDHPPPPDPATRQAARQARQAARRGTP